jgi:excisionase family DNA binding protein
MSEAEPLSITEAAQRLGVSVRTVQRRLDAGTLEAAFEGDTRRVMIRDTTRQADATEGDTQRDTSRDSDTPQGDTLARHNATDGAPNAPNESEATRQSDAPQRDTSRDTTRQGDSEAARVLAETEAAFLREALEVSRANEAFLRGAIEQHQRSEAELRAALRKALEAMPKRIEGREYSQPENSAQSGLEASKSGAAGIVSGTQKNAAQSVPRREARPLWKVILGLR